MAFAKSWDLSTPAGTSRIQLGDDAIRTHMAAVQERLNVDHYAPADDPTANLVDNAATGQHRQATLRERAAPGSVAADLTVVYAKELGGKSGLAVMNEDEKEKELLQVSADGNYLCLKLNAQDLKLSGAAALTDEDTLTVDTTTGELRAGTGSAGLGIKYGNLDTATGAFCDQNSVRIGATGVEAAGKATQVVGTSDIDCTSAVLADMPDMTVTVTTNGGPLLIHFSATLLAVNTGYLDNAMRNVRFSLFIDGVVKHSARLTCRDMTTAPGWYGIASLQWLETSLAAGSHTAKIQWANVSSGITIRQQGTVTPRVLYAEQKADF